MLSIIRDKTPLSQYFGKRFLYALEKVAYWPKCAKTICCCSSTCHKCPTEQVFDHGIGVGTLCYGKPTRGASAEGGCREWETF